MQINKKQIKSQCREDDCSGAKATDLATLIRCYRVNHIALLEMLEYFRKLSLTEAIRRGAGAVGSGEKMYSHQYRLGHATCKKAANILLKAESQIAECDSFDELLRLITEYTSSVKGFGELARYDAALRIGANLGKLPKVVNLHAGTKEGAKNWGLDTRKGYLRLDELDEEFHRFKMKPHDIENFFCNYKDELKSLRARLRGTHGRLSRKTVSTARGGRC